MKLKKRVRIVLLVIVVIAIAILGFLAYKSLNSEKKVAGAKVVSKIEKYGYTLKDTKTKRYKEMFKELKKILEEDEVNEEDYAKKISEMFIYDFYSLKDKNAKTDIGGVDFVYPDVLENFLQNAQNTYYKYVENNIYDDRNQKLPEVNEITIDSINKEAFTYVDKTDEEAYTVEVSWDYTDKEFSSYQKKATLKFVHDDIKLYLVELQ